MVILIVRSLLAELLVAGTFISSYAAACRLLRFEPTWLRWTGVVGCGGFLASVGFHLLSELHAFNPAGSTMAVVGLTCAMLWPGTGERSLGGLAYSGSPVPSQGLVTLPSQSSP